MGHATVLHRAVLDRLGEQGALDQRHVQPDDLRGAENDGAWPVRPRTAGFCGGISGSTGAHGSSLISRGGRDTDLTIR